MTQNSKSTTVSTAKKDGNKKPSKADEILATVTVTPETEKPEKRGRGRPRGSKGKPKKGKPTYTKAKYKEHPMAKGINEVICAVINKTFLKDAEEKLETNEIEMGEASLYCLDYYWEDLVGHPVMIIIMASIGLGAVVWDKSKTKKPKSKEKTAEEGYLLP